MDRVQDRDLVQDRAPDPVPDHVHALEFVPDHGHAQGPDTDHSHDRVLVHDRDLVQI